jgi:hypothetical protein
VRHEDGSRHRDGANGVHDDSDARHTGTLAGGCDARFTSSCHPRNPRRRHTTVTRSSSNRHRRPIAFLLATHFIKERHGADYAAWLASRRPGGDSDRRVRPHHFRRGSRRHVHRARPDLRARSRQIRPGRPEDLSGGRS